MIDESEKSPSSADEAKRLLALYDPLGAELRALQVEYARLEKRILKRLRRQSGRRWRS